MWFVRGENTMDGEKIVLELKEAPNADNIMFQSHCRASTNMAIG